MKPVNHQETHTTIEETPSNNRDTNKNKKEFVGLRAGYGQHASFP